MMDLEGKGLLEDFISIPEALFFFKSQGCYSLYSTKKHH